MPQISCNGSIGLGMEQNWESYKKWIAEATRNNRRNYYRGQSDSEWNLKTTFHRNAEFKEISLAHYFGTIMNDVNYQVAAFEAPINFQNNAEYSTILGKLQHHGFPTPLLDWTLSGYVAAYFAFKSAPIQPKSTDKVSNSSEVNFNLTKSDNSLMRSICIFFNLPYPVFCNLLIPLLLQILQTKYYLLLLLIYQSYH